MTNRARLIRRVLRGAYTAGWEFTFRIDPEAGDVMDFPETTNFQRFSPERGEVEPIEPNPNPKRRGHVADRPRG